MWQADRPVLEVAGRSPPSSATIAITICRLRSSFRLVSRPLFLVGGLFVPSAISSAHDTKAMGMFCCRNVRDRSCTPSHACRSVSSPKPALKFICCKGLTAFSPVMARGLHLFFDHSHFASSQVWRRRGSCLFLEAELPADARGATRQEEWRAGRY